MTDHPSDVRSWRTEAVPRIECFQARGMVHDYGRHSHPTYSIGVMEAGAGCTEYRGGSHWISSGEIVAMNPDEPHTGYSRDDRPMSYRMFYIESDAMQEMAGGSQTGDFRELRIRDAYFAQQLRSLHALLGTSGDPLEQQCLTQEVLTGFARRYAVGNPLIIFNMSVWESIEMLKAYAYSHQHGQAFRDRKHRFNFF